MFLTPSLQSLGIVLLHVFVKVDGFLLLFSLGFHFLLVVARLRVARCCEDNKTTDAMPTTTLQGITQSTKQPMRLKKRSKRFRSSSQNSALTDLGMASSIFLGASAIVAFMAFTASVFFLMLSFKSLRVAQIRKTSVGMDHQTTEAVKIVTDGTGVL